MEVRIKIESSVLQIIDKKTGELEYKTIAKGQLSKFIDKIDGQNGIGGRLINNKVYHLTSKTPEDMEKRGFIFTGQAKFKDLPV